MKLKPLQYLKVLKFLCQGYIEFDFDNLEKSLKALEIIKNLKPNMRNLYYLLHFKEPYETFIKSYINIQVGTPVPSEEEYDLLKEVFIDE